MANKQAKEARGSLKPEAASEEGIQNHLEQLPFPIGTGFVAIPKKATVGVQLHQKPQKSLPNKTNSNTYNPLLCRKVHCFAKRNALAVRTLRSAGRLSNGN